LYIVAIFLFYSYGEHRNLHSFPTRRSSDLEVMGQFFKVAKQVFQPTSIDEACQQIRDQVRAYMTVAIEERATMQVVKEAIGSSEDRKSTRLNSSHVSISYAVFCLKKKKT